MPVTSFMKRRSLASRAALLANAFARIRKTDATPGLPAFAYFLASSSASASVETSGGSSSSSSASGSAWDLAISLFSRRFSVSFLIFAWRPSLKRSSLVTMILGSPVS